MGFPNIFLIGFMGSGKSHWGRIWAKGYQLSFIDLDEEIELSFGMKVEDIFEKYSEEKFREMEKFHLKKNENKKGILIACGGGTPCFFDNMDWMLKNGIVVYLNASDRFILEHVKEETKKRPLLKEVSESELLFFIQHKLAEREPTYRRANYILDVQTLNEKSLDMIFRPAEPKKIIEQKASNHHA